MAHAPSSKKHILRKQPSHDVERLKKLRGMKQMMRGKALQKKLQKDIEDVEYRNAFNG